jgi:hypothetical protein
MNWRCGSSGRVPALQVQSPECKLQSHSKKKKKEWKREELKLRMCGRMAEMVDGVWVLGWGNGESEQGRFTLLAFTHSCSFKP